MIWLTIAVALLAYPVIAGMVFRSLDPPDRCDGMALPMKFENDPWADPKRHDVYRCVGPWAGIAHTYACRSCWEWKEAFRYAQWWPISISVEVVVRLFEAGASVRVIGKAEQREPSERTP